MRQRTGLCRRDFHSGAFERGRGGVNLGAKPLVFQHEPLLFLLDRRHRLFVRGKALAPRLIGRGQLLQLFVAELLRKGDGLVVSGEGAATEPPLKRGQKPTMPKSPLGPTRTSLSRLIEQVKDALVVLNQPLRYVARLRRMQGIIFRVADKLPEWGAESAHSNRGAFLQSHQYRRRDIRLIERFRICQ
jgi:hypothetical protein